MTYSNDSKPSASTYSAATEGGVRITFGQPIGLLLALTVSGLPSTVYSNDSKGSGSYSNDSEGA